jgi:hypothetical protein
MKWMNANSKASVIIVMKNISQATNLRNKILFMAISEDISEEDVDTPLMSKSPETLDITPPLNPPEVEPIISLNALTGFSAPQTLKLISYIKHREGHHSG